MRKRRRPQPSQLGYSTRTPDGMGNRTSPRRAQTPGIYTVWRAQRPAVLPPAVPPAARKHKAPTPVGADLMPARPLPPRGCPEAAHSSPLAVRHASVILGRSRPFAPLAPSPRPREGVRGLPDLLCRHWPRRDALTSLRALLRDMLIGCHLWRSRWRISRSAPTRPDGSNLITGVRSISP